MLVSSSSSLSSGSAQPPTGVPPQTEAEGGRRRVYAAGSGRGWSGGVAKRLSAGGRGACCRCCYHAQRRVKRARAHMACPHPRTAALARTRTACGGALGRLCTRRQGRRSARRRPAGAKANAYARERRRGAPYWRCLVGGRNAAGALTNTLVSVLVILPEVRELLPEVRAFIRDKSLEQTPHRGRRARIHALRRT